MDLVARQQLRAVLLARFRWLGDLEFGPQAVEAGECDRCGVEARLVQTCGPGPARYVGRRCAQQLGGDAWCGGHATEAAAALSWLRQLPDQADAAARLWWVATGEIGVPADVEAALRRRLALEDHR